MNLAEFSIRRSLFVNMLSVFLIFAGLFGMFGMRREAFPNVSFDVVQVSTIYRGATPEEVEKLVTLPLEKELKGVDNIDEMSSVSRDSNSLITIKLSPDITNKYKVVSDIQKAVDRVTDLPEDADDPIVTDIEMKQHPVIEVSLSGNFPESELQHYADILEDEFLEIDGVARISKRGYRDKQIWIEVDPVKLKEDYVSMGEIIEALKWRNVTIPGGKVTDEDIEYSIRTSGEFYNPEEIEDIIIRSNDAGNFLKIKDIARVKRAFEDEDFLARVNGKPSITLVVINKEKADTINVASEVKEKIKQFRKRAPEGLEVSWLNDLSYYINRRLKVLRTNGVFGFIFVLGALFLFLNRVSAIMTAFGIPLAIFTTLAVMNILGMSINLMTMFGFIMVLGMLVDDGIIISENISRYIEEGVSPKEAAIKGTGEVMFPVLATVLTTVVAFTPLMLMSGLIGKFVRVIPQVVIIALAASLIEAFIILPSHMAYFSRPVDPSIQRSKREKKWFKRLLNRYSKMLEKALKRKYLVIAGAVVAFFLAVFVGTKVVPMVLFSGRGVEFFMVRAEVAQGTPLEKTAELMEPVEKLVNTLPKSDLDSFVTEVGIVRERRGYDPNEKQGSNYAQITVYLTPMAQREKSAKMIADSLRSELAKIGGFKELNIVSFVEGPPTGRPVELQVRGDEFSILNKLSGQIKEFLKGIDGVSDIRDNYDFGKLELGIVIDENKTKAAGLSINRIARSVRNAFQGGVATSIRLPRAEKEIDVLVKFPVEVKKDFSIFDSLFIPNNKGKLIALNKVATIEKRKGLSSIRHLDGKRVIVVSADVDNKKVTPIKVDGRLRRKFSRGFREFPGYMLKYGGQQKETRESLRSLFRAFLLAFILIFIILTTQFKSLLQPLVVMSAIPFAIIGVVIAFFFHHEPFSFLALMGIIGLAGVVVNDSIVLMDFINRSRREGYSRREAIMRSGRLRMRPVLLTTITTVAGLMPTAYGLGGFDPFIRPMALAISWGLLFATVLTLIVIPCIYEAMDELAVKVIHRTTLIRDNSVKK